MDWKIRVGIFILRLIAMVAAADFSCDPKSTHPYWQRLIVFSACLVVWALTGYYEGFMA